MVHLSREKHKSRATKTTRHRESTSSSSSSDDDTDVVARGKSSTKVKRMKTTKVTYTSGLKAGDNLPDKMRNKIWRHKYVDFYTLLNPDHEESYSLALNNKRQLDPDSQEKTTVN